MRFVLGQRVGMIVAGFTRHRGGAILHCSILRGSRLLALLFALSPLFHAGKVFGASVRSPDCGSFECRSPFLVAASMFGEDERRTERQFAKQRNLSLREVQNRYAASGAITCRGFGKGRRSRAVVYASGQLTLRNDIITTTAHTIIGKDAKPLGNLENCVFETSIDGRKVRSRLTKDYFTGFSDPDDANFAGFDWAVIRLKDTLPVEPYPVVDNLAPMFRWLDVAIVTKVSSFNFDNWGPKRTRQKSLAECAVKPEIVAWSSGVRSIRTDCDISPGNSGGAILSELSGRPALAGIMVGTTSASFKQRKRFDLYNDYNIGALLEGEFLRAVREMAMVMSVAEVQSALKQLGYDPGPEDGLAGKRTRRAIKAFQKDRGIEQTGVISVELSRALKETEPGGGSADLALSGSSNIVTDLYAWRLAASSRTTVLRPDWLPASTGNGDGFGPQSAWTSSKLSGCRNVIACLKESGAPGDALRAAYMLEKTGLIGSYVSKFDEYGPVDLATIRLSYTSAEQPEYALVNSPNGAMSLRSSDIRESGRSFDGFRQIRKAHSGAGIRMNPRFEGYRLLQDGGQRFVFAYPITNGCLACLPVAKILFAFDFRPDGRLDRLLPLATSQTDIGQRWYSPQAYASEQFIDDTAMLQLRLNELGYPAGPIDGVEGRRTEKALRDFQRDYGFVPTGKTDIETAEVLSASRLDRQIRRFEMLLATHSSRTVSYGKGLLSRIGDNVREKRTILANNLAGRMLKEGRIEEGLRLLRRALSDTGTDRDQRPLLYTSILLNLASGTMQAGLDDEADRHVRAASSILRRRSSGEEAGNSARNTITGGSLQVRLSALQETLIDRIGEGHVRFSLDQSKEGYRTVLTLLYGRAGTKDI